MRALAIVALLLPALAAAADRSLSGAVGLSLSGGGQLRALASSTGVPEQRLLYADLTATLSLDENGHALSLGAMYSPTVEGAAFSPALGYRGHFGVEEWKTFFDAGVAAEFQPRWGVGPRLGFGVQYDFHPLFGAFALLDGRLLFGRGVIATVSVGIGIQARSYLLQ